MRVNLKGPGDCFGEVSLLYTTPRSATVAATLDSAVWVLERETFRQVVIALSALLHFSPRTVSQNFMSIVIDDQDMYLT